MCGIKAEVAESTLQNPNQGFIGKRFLIHLVPNIEIGPICSKKVKIGPPNDQSQALSQEIYEILIKYKII